MAQKLTSDFYCRPDPLLISKELLGKHLCTCIDGKNFTRGMIVEVEAYCGMTDRACHAFGGRRTKRNQIMYHQGGVAYVYLCYGIHHLFNIVTNQAEYPDAILIRAIQPIEGIEIMFQRRQQNILNYKLTSGPGVLTQALGISIVHNQCSLSGSQIWLEEHNQTITENQIISTERIGISYAGEDAHRPWRFYLVDNPWVSKKINPSYPQSK